MLDAVVEASEVKRGYKILEYGARTGALTIRLLEKEPSCEITAIFYPYYPTPPAEAEPLTIGEDLSKWLQYFKEHLKISGHKDKVEIKEIPLLDITGEGSFDLIVSSYALHHYKEKFQVLQKIYRLLKPNGKFIFNERFFSFSENMSKEERLRVVLEKLLKVAPTVMKYCGEDAAMKLFDNYKLTYLRDREYPLSLDGYIEICNEAGFMATIYNVDWIYDNVVLKCSKPEVIS